MVKKATSKQNTLTQEFLIKELRASEQRLEKRLDQKFEKQLETSMYGVEKRFNKSFETRLDARLELQTQMLKEYIDAGLTQVGLRIDNL